METFNLNSDLKINTPSAPEPKKKPKADKESDSESEESDNEGDEKEEKVEPENELEKMNLMHLIERYKLKFPEDLKLVNTENLQSKSLKELNMIREKMSFFLGADSSVGLFGSCVDMGIDMWEGMASLAGARCKGLSVKLNRMKEWEKLKAEIELKHADLIHQPPEVRAALLIVGATYKLHKLNEGLLESMAPSTGTVSPEIINKWQDF
jgi:hypothetical protein